MPGRLPPPGPGPPPPMPGRLPPGPPMPGRLPPPAPGQDRRSRAIASRSSRCPADRRRAADPGRLPGHRCRDDYHRRVPGQARRFPGDCRRRSRASARRCPGRLPPPIPGPGPPMSGTISTAELRARTADAWAIAAADPDGPPPPSPGRGRRSRAITAADSAHARSITPLPGSPGRVMLPGMLGRVTHPDQVDSGVDGRVIPPGLGRLPCIPPPPMAGRFCGVDGRVIPPMAGLPAFMAGRAPPPPPGRPPPPARPRCAWADSHVPRMIRRHASGNDRSLTEHGKPRTMDRGQKVETVRDETSRPIRLSSQSSRSFGIARGFERDRVYTSDSHLTLGAAPEPRPVSGPERAASGAGALRTITTSTISGATWPPMMRSIELVLTESLLMIV